MKRHIGLVNEHVPALVEMWPVQPRTLDQDAARRFGLTEVEIVQAEELLDLGYDPHLYLPFPRFRLVNAPVVLGAMSFVLTVLLALPALFTGNSFQRGPHAWLGFAVAFAIGAALGGYVLIQRLVDRKEQGFRDLLSGGFDGTSPAVTIWKGAVQAARSAEQTMRPQDFVECRQVMRALRYRIVAIGDAAAADPVVGDLVDRVERMASTGRPPRQP